MEKEFVRVRSAVDYIISLVLLVGGCAIVIAPTKPAVNIVGIFAIFAGILLIVILRSAWKDKADGHKYHRKEMYFPQSLKDRIMGSVTGNIESLDTKEEDKGNGLRVDIFFSRKSGKAYIRLYEYIPYRYESCTPYYEYDIDKLGKLIK